MAGKKNSEEQAQEASKPTVKLPAEIRAVFDAVEADNAAGLRKAFVSLSDSPERYREFVAALAWTSEEGNEILESLLRDPKGRPYADLIAAGQWERLKPFPKDLLEKHWRGIEFLCHEFVKWCHFFHYHCHCGHHWWDWPKLCWWRKCLCCGILVGGAPDGTPTRLHTHYLDFSNQFQVAKSTATPYLTTISLAPGSGLGAHASTHQQGGSDPVNVAGLPGELADPQKPKVHAPSHQQGGADPINVAGLSGELADPQKPKTHAPSHQQGGGDAINVAGLSGELADPQKAKAHAASHQQGGADALNVAGLSGELADPQKVKLHAAAHQNGGGDALNVAGLAGELADPQKTKAHAPSHNFGGVDALTLHEVAAIPFGTLLQGDLLGWRVDGNNDRWQRKPGFVVGSTINPPNLNAVVMPRLAGANAGNTVVVASGAGNRDGTGMKPVGIQAQVINETTLRLTCFDPAGIQYNAIIPQVEIQYAVFRNA